MDGGGDFEDDAARLGPGGLELLGHAAEILKPRPATYETAAEIDEDIRAITAAGVVCPPRLLALLEAAKKGRTAIAKIAPPIGRQAKDKGGSDRALREALYVEIIIRLQPLLGEKKPEMTMTAAEMNRAIDSLFENYLTERWPSQKDMKQQPARGARGYDDILWRLMRLSKPARFTYQTLLNLLNKRFPKRKRLSKY